MAYPTFNGNVTLGLRRGLSLPQMIGTVSLMVRLYTIVNGRLKACFQACTGETSICKSLIHIQTGSILSTRLPTFGCTQGLKWKNVVAGAHMVQEKESKGALNRD